MRRAVVALVLMTVAAPAMAASPLASVRGPVAGALRAHLKAEEVGCPTDPERDCSALSTVIDARIVYGRFPGRRGGAAVAFVDEDSGGSGALMSAIVWVGGPKGYRLLGETKAFGGDARDVSFLPGRVISYVGTVMRTGDVHAAPTGRQRFRLVLGRRGVTFVEGGLLRSIPSRRRSSPLRAGRPSPHP